MFLVGCWMNANIFVNVSTITRVSFAVNFFCHNTHKFYLLPDTKPAENVVEDFFAGNFSDDGAQEKEAFPDVLRDKLGAEVAFKAGFYPLNGGEGVA